MSPPMYGSLVLRSGRRHLDLLAVRLLSMALTQCFPKWNQLEACNDGKNFTRALLVLVYCSLRILWQVLNLFKQLKDWIKMGAC